MVDERTRRSFHLLVGTMLTIGTSVIGNLLTWSLTDQQSWWTGLGWFAAGIVVTFFYLRWQLRSQEESPSSIKAHLSELESELRSQVQSRSYGARRKLVGAPLKELDLDITPRVGWVRDPRLTEPDPFPGNAADPMAAAFESSKRRLLIVGGPGSGKTMAVYSLIEYLDKNESAEGRIPLLVNLSAWEAQENFEAFLVDYLCSAVGYREPQRAVANAFVKSRRYSLFLDGLDEIPAGLRVHFSEHLDEFVRGLPGEVGVVVTCRIQEYRSLRKSYPDGLGLVRAVRIRRLTDQQLDRAFSALANGIDKGWKTFLPQRHPKAYQRVRRVLSNPLFLNLAVIGRLSPHEVPDCDTKQELQTLVIDRYLDRTLQDQKLQYEPADARRYLAWIARFLKGVEVSPFGLKRLDPTVFDLANLTPPEPPRRYRVFEAQIFGLLLGLIWGLLWGLLWGLVEARPDMSTSKTPTEAHTRSLKAALAYGSVYGLVVGPSVGLIGWLLWWLAAFDGALIGALSLGLGVGLGVGMHVGMNNGGWFVVLQKVAHRRLVRADKLPPHLSNFLEWGIDRQIFRQVGGGVRFRHNLIQQHLAST